MKNWFSNLTSCLSPRDNSDPLGLHDNRLWSEDLRKHAYGEFSLAVVQANIDVEDQSQVQAGRQATFVGVYDGHGGPNASRYVAGHLFNHLNRLARDLREISENIISNAIAETERGYLGFVRQAAFINDGGAGPAGGSCCLVGVIWNGRLYVGNLGDSRAVLGVFRENRIHAEQVTEDHNANLDNIRIELQARHLGDPHIVVKNNGRWRVRDVLEVTRAIGDFDLKYPELAAAPVFPACHGLERLRRPYIRDDPQLHGRDLADCRFVIFASDGLWDWVTNQEAINIVHKGPREGIARRLAVKAMQNAGKKRRKTYTDLKHINPGQRRNFHDDITVVVIFIDSLDPVDESHFSPITVQGNQPNVAPSNFEF